MTRAAAWSGIGRLLARHAVRRLRREPVRAALLFLAVGLGAAVLVAVLYASEASVRSFERTLSTLGGEDSAEIRARGGRFFAADAAPLYRALQPHFDTVALWESTVEAGHGPRRLLAADPFELQHRFKGADAPVGRGSAAWALLSPAGAAALGVDAGDPLSLKLGEKTASVEAALATGELADALGSDGILTSFEAVSSLRPRDELTAISVRPKQAGERALAELLLVLSPSRSPAFFLGNVRQKAAQAERLFAAFRLNIGVLVLMTLLVCAFTVFGAAQISVTSLQRELGVMRTLGFGRGALAGVVLIEAALIGCGGALTGVTLGRPVTELCARLFVHTVSTLYGGGRAPITVWNVSPWLVWGAAFAAGVGVCVAGAGIPAWRASKSAPAAAARGAIPPPSRRFTRGVASGLVLFVLAGLLAIIARSAGLAFPAHGAAFLLVGGLVVMGGGALLACAGALKTVVPRRFGTAGLIAVSNVISGARVLGLAVSTSTVGLALLIGLTLMVGSFRSTLAAWVDYTIRADVFVRPTALGTLDRPARLPVDFGAQLARLPGIEAVGRFSAFEFDTGTGSVTVGGTDFLTIPGARTFRILAGSLDRAALRAGSSVLISEAAAKKFGRGVGEHLTVAGRTAAVAGVFKDFSTEHGIVLFDFDRFEDFFGRSGWSSASIYARDAVSAAALAASLRAGDQGRELLVQRNDELRDSIFAIFDQTFEITALMRLIVVVVCALGFVITVLQLQLERRSDLRTLRTLGAGRRELHRAVFIEGGMMLVPSLVGGLFGGIALALILVYLVNPASFGWTLDFVAAPEAFLLPVLVVSGSTIVGAFLATRLPEPRFAGADSGVEDE